MRYQRVLVIGAIAAAIGISAPIWWPTQAQGINMAGFKRYPPEDFFNGEQLKLAQAIRDGDLVHVKELAPKTDLAAPGTQNMTLLAFAFQEAVPAKTDANNDRLRIVSELVKDGAKPQQTFGKNGNIAYVAARADTPNFMKALLAGGMSPDMRYDGDTPLLFATAEERELPQLKVLIESKANVNIRNSLGETALFDATRLRQWDVVDYLIAHGADPSVKNDNGLTYAKVLANELAQTPKDSAQLARIDAIQKRVSAAAR